MGANSVLDVYVNQECEICGRKNYKMQATVVCNICGGTGKVDP